MVTRRQLLASGSLSVLGLTGCLAGGEQSLPLSNLEFELVNNTDAAHVFTYAFETTDGVAQWHSPAVAPREAKWIDPEARPSSAVAIHVVVDDEPLTRDLTAYDERGYIMIEYHGDQPEVNAFTGDNAPETPVRGRNRGKETTDDAST